MDGATGSERYTLSSSITLRNKSLGVPKSLPVSAGDSRGESLPREVPAFLDESGVLGHFKVGFSRLDDPSLPI